MEMEETPKEKIIEANKTVYRSFETKTEYFEYVRDMYQQGKSVELESVDYLEFTEAEK